MAAQLVAGLFLVPWLATLAGSLAALRMRIGSERRQGALLGFAAGVMVAASVWSLILPAFDEAGGGAGIALVTLGFALGCAGLFALDKVVPHQHRDAEAPEGRPTRASKPLLLVYAVALHNLPEGLALGVVMAACLSGRMGWAAAISFGLGLALQNFPEGMAVTLPMRQAGMERRAVRRFGVFSSFAEPAAAVVGLLGASALDRLGGVVMPILLSVAAGAMVFIVVEELIPESQSANVGHSATLGFLGGFWLMAVMGVLGG